MSQSFDQWLDEIEVFSTRRERAIDDLGPDYERWLLAAWQGGMDTLTGRTKKQELSPVVKGYNEGLIHGFELAASLVEQRTGGLFTLVDPDEISEARARKARAR